MMRRLEKRRISGMARKKLGRESGVMMERKRYRY
jgi:hypothetical protein